MDDYSKKTAVKQLTETRSQFVGECSGVCWEVSCLVDWESIVLLHPRDGQQGTETTTETGVRPPVDLTHHKQESENS